jgi:hypothetical protein
MERVSSLITQKLKIIAEAPGADPAVQSKYKAISSLFLYAVRLERDGQRGMIDEIFRAASKSTSGRFMWHHVEPYFTTLFNESSSPSLNRVITLAAPYAGWAWRPYTQNAVARWAAAASTIPYSEEVGRSVVDALFQIAFNYSLRRYIPIEIWAWLKRRPSLPPVCRGRSLSTSSEAVSHIRGLENIELLKSYLLLVWSEWNDLYESGLDEMEIVIREEFDGILMWRHREDLIERLDHVLGQLDQDLDYFKQYNQKIGEDQIARAKEQYGRLKEVLVEVDEVAMKTLSRAPPNLIQFNENTNACDCV